MNTLGRAIGVTAVLLFALESVFILAAAIYVLGMSHPFANGTPYGYPMWWALMALVCVSAIAPFVTVFIRKMAWRMRLSIAALPLAFALVMFGAEAAYAPWIVLAHSVGR